MVGAQRIRSRLRGPTRWRRRGVSIQNRSEPRRNCWRGYTRVFVILWRRGGCRKAGRPFIGPSRTSLGGSRESAVIPTGALMWSTANARAGAGMGSALLSGLVAILVTWLASRWLGRWLAVAIGVSVGAAYLGVRLKSRTTGFFRANLRCYCAARRAGQSVDDAIESMVRNRYRSTQEQQQASRLIAGVPTPGLDKAKVMQAVYVMFCLEHGPPLDHDVRVKHTADLASLYERFIKRHHLPG